MKLINVMELILSNLLELHWTSFNMPCPCEICRMDTLAIALNHVSPRYVSSENTFAYIKAEFLDKQSQTNLLVQLSSAAKKVAENPHYKENLQPVTAMSL